MSVSVITKPISHYLLLLTGQSTWHRILSCWASVWSCVSTLEISLRSVSQKTYLITLMTRHVMRAAVNTQMKMTMLFRVGRCVIRGEIRDPTAASVALYSSSSWLKMDDDVEFNCVAGEGFSGSPLTRQRTVAIKVRARLDVNIMTMKLSQKCKIWSSVFFFSPSKLDKTRRQLSHHTQSTCQCQILLFTQ